MALGANRGQVLRMILRQGMWIVGIGLVAGLVVGYFFGPAMRALLGNISPRDPVVYATTIVALALTGFVASIVPAWRAASVDPLAALRDG
jgi:ABC-type antimicrobial peptide transport system permease subunit